VWGDGIDDREDAVRAAVVALLEVVALGGHCVGDVGDTHNVSPMARGIRVERSCFHLDRKDSGGFRGLDFGLGLA
jgi:hypothetical protein